jgi:hypothetical protein
MTGSRMSIARRPRTFVRRAIVTLVTGAGLALTPLPALANTAPPPPAAAPPASVPAPTAAAQTAVNTALAQLGDPYAWGGAGPDAYDCSGLTGLPKIMSTCAPDRWHPHWSASWRHPRELKSCRHTTDAVSVD